MLRATVGRRRPTVKGKTPVSLLPEKIADRPARKSPERWTRPIPPGVLPAYDEALKVIRADAVRISREAAAAKRELLESVKVLKTLEGEAKAEKEREVEDIRKLQRILQVQSQINLPEVRWACRRGRYDMHNVAHRHLREQKWRNDGKLDLLMERLHQLKVIPDVLRDLRPTVDVSLTVRPGLNSAAYRPTIVEPGSYLEPLTTVKPPTVFATAFHSDTRLYTMLLVDSDVPDEVNETYTSYLHWMCPNVPLSAFTSGPLKYLNEHTRYIPPHPQEGTKFHRYTFLMLPQPAISDYSLSTEARAGRNVTSKKLFIPVVKDRKAFNVRQFMKQWNLDGRQGGGAHMWRAVWDPAVNAIYQGVFGEVPPRFVQPRRFDRHLEERGRQKYINVN